MRGDTITMLMYVRIEAGFCTILCMNAAEDGVGRDDDGGCMRRAGVRSVR